MIRLPWSGYVTEENAQEVYDAIIEDFMGGKFEAKGKWKLSWHVDSNIDYPSGVDSTTDFTQLRIETVKSCSMVSDPTEMYVTCVANATVIVGPFATLIRAKKRHSGPWPGKCESDAYPWVSASSRLIQVKTVFVVADYARSREGLVIVPKGYREVCILEKLA